jgi:hypothetical protein
VYLKEKLAALRRAKQTETVSAQTRQSANDCALPANVVSPIPPTLSGCAGHDPNISKVYPDTRDSGSHSEVDAPRSLDVADFPRKQALEAEPKDRAPIEERPPTLDELYELHQRLESERKALQAKYGVFLTRHKELVDRFFEIAERKVAVLDEYGDENWDALTDEIQKFLNKVAKRDPFIDVSRSEVKSDLESAFRAYNEERKKEQYSEETIRGLTGIEFETYLANRLKEAGFENITGTPVTGDQGADILAHKNGRTIAIQAKGYRCPVGNAAVQEIVAALRFYKADEGWVVTNSAFTASARALAHANRVRLIDGNDLKRLQG